MITTCPEPIQKYRELQEMFQQFQKEWKKISETGKMPEGLEDLKKEIEKRRQEFDRLLEKYFFVFEFGEKIEGFGANINITHPLDGAHFLVAGSAEDDGEIRILDLTDRENPKFSEEIEGFKNWINTIQPIDDTHFLVAGSNGEIRILDLTDRENPKFSEKIEGFDNMIITIQPINDTHFLVAGENGEIRILDLTNRENPKFSPNLNDLTKDENLRFKDWINTIQSIDDKHFLVAGSDGEIRILTKKLDLSEVEDELE